MSSNVQTIPKSAITDLEGFLGYTFRDKDLAREAMQRLPSERPIDGRTLQQANKRLAVVGDFVIDLLLSQSWYASNENLSM